MFVHNTPTLKNESWVALHRTLRAETRGDHSSIDQMISRLDLSRPDDYGLFLNLHFCALQELRAEWRHEDIEDFRVMTRCLQNDLRVLGKAVALPRPTTRSALTAHNRLGVAYVIRGSRLGASVLRCQVPSRLAASYLDFRPTLSWAQFVQQLDRSCDAVDSTATDEVIHGARLTFQVFSQLLVHALG